MGSLVDIEEKWSLCDVLDGNEVLDIREEIEAIKAKRMGKKK